MKFVADSATSSASNWSASAHRPLATSAAAALLPIPAVIAGDAFMAAAAFRPAYATVTASAKRPARYSR